MTPNRYICQTLEEMRACYKTYNFACIAGLIEEVQSMANRMEAALQDKSDLEYYREELKITKENYDRLSKEVRDLSREIARLEAKREELMA